jgi:glycerophosphoryl diester phosphodiesterase
LDVFYNDEVAALQIPMSQSGINLATRSLVRKAQRHNIAVHYWTIDDEADMRKLIKIGADGIMTNVPSKLAKVLNEETK